MPETASYTAPAAPPDLAEPPRRRRRPLIYQGSRTSLGFRAVIVFLGALITVVLVVVLVQLARQVYEEYGWHVGTYFSSVFDSTPILTAARNTFIVVIISCVLATLVATVLAWLNEGTEASLGWAGSLMPVVPFLMPALSLPLGWTFVAAPQAGIMNILLRDVLRDVGIHLTQGPVNIYSWYGMIFLYTIFLTGFAYLIMSSAIRNVDTNILEAARLAGAGPLKIFRQILIPSIKSSFLSAFLLCLMPALAMYTIPFVIGPYANINILSVSIVGMVNGLYPPHYGQAFISGLMLLVPILLAWLVARRSGRRGQAVLSASRGSLALMRLGRRGRRIGRTVLVLYVIIAVVLPVLGLLWVSGISFWGTSLSSHWDPITNLQLLWHNSEAVHGVVNSVLLGVVGGGVIMVVAQLLAYGQRLFPRFGGLLDGLVKAPAAIASILLAMGILLTFGGPPFNFSGSYQLLFIGFFLAFLPFASVVANAGQLQMGKDVIEASQVSGGSELRTFRRIVRPLVSSNFAAGWVLVFILIIGDVNLSLLLSSSTRPTVGYAMLDLQIDAAFPSIATYSLVVALVNVVVTALLAVVTIGLRRKR
jgi:iron(III) transport system permease protein